MTNLRQPEYTQLWQSHLNISGDVLIITTKTLLTRFTMIYLHVSNASSVFESDTQVQAPGERRAFATSAQVQVAKDEVNRKWTNWIRSSFVPEGTLINRSAYCSFPPTHTARISYILICVAIRFHIFLWRFARQMRTKCAAIAWQLHWAPGSVCACIMDIHENQYNWHLGKMIGYHKTICQPEIQSNSACRALFPHIVPSRSFRRSECWGMSQVIIKMAYFRTLWNVWLDRQ